MIAESRGVKMKEIFETAGNNPLFGGIAYNEFERMFACLSARIARYKKNRIILLSGDAVAFVGLILSGGVRIIKEDENGNASILAELSAPEMFGEILACAGIKNSPVTIFAAADTEILMLDNKKIMTSCGAECPWHKRFIQNMLTMIAKKNFLLNRKIEILSKRTTREKLMCYFDLQRRGAKKFAIPFNREELADYLCVDRSALSRELCKMRDLGLIRFHKSTFEIL